MKFSTFARYIGIDYSGAKTPTASLKGLRVFLAEDDAPPAEAPRPSPKKYWTRRGIAKCLVERLAEEAPTLVGIDHGFSFPLRYFEAYGLKPDWPTFLDDFQRHWPTDADNTYVDFVRDGTVGNGAARMGNPRWGPPKKFRRCSTRGPRQSLKSRCSARCANERPLVANTLSMGVIFQRVCRCAWKVRQFLS
jgi:hypothetical protein